MYCNQCGRQIPDGSSFCCHCGAAVGTSRSLAADLSYDRQKEIGEAVQAGKRALQSLCSARDELGKARNWGIVDLVGGGLISTLVKRSKMSNAQTFIEQAKADLKKFSDELDDVHGLAQLDIDTDDFLNFADWFFDGFVVDFMVQDRINKAQGQVEEAIRRVENILHRLGG